MSSVNEISKASKLTLDPKKSTVGKSEQKNPSHTPKNDTHEKAEKSITEQELHKAVEETNRIIFGDNEKFEFKIHERTGRFLVKLVDNETEETIREIPPEKILDLIANIWEMVGILVDERG